MRRGGARFVVARSTSTRRHSVEVQGTFIRIAVGAPVLGLDRVRRLRGLPASELQPGRRHHRADPLLLYFTSGDHRAAQIGRAQPDLPYPIGHLSTMYWIGLQPGDVHLNISSPGWAKHAWSNVFAPWLAGATVLALQLRAVRRRPP